MTIPGYPPGQGDTLTPPLNGHLNLPVLPMPMTCPRPVLVWVPHENPPKSTLRCSVVPSQATLSLEEPRMERALVLDDHRFPLFPPLLVWNASFPSILSGTSV